MAGGTSDLTEESAAGSTSGAGRSTGDDEGRKFPCPQCGGELVFNIGQQSLRCPYCGLVKELTPADEIEEQDFEAMLQKLGELRATGVTDQQETSEVRCDGCGANVVFQGNLTSSECPYCGSPLQRDHVHTSEVRVPVDGVLPFLVKREIAFRNLRDWVRSRWFAPNEFLKRGVEGRFNGVYFPYWTYDAMTFTRYQGQRGEHYYVTVRRNNQTHQERRTRWYPASGEFERFFDDVLTFAANGLPSDLMQSLEPWPLQNCLKFNDELLAGFLSRTYDIPLDVGFGHARGRIEQAVASEARQRIGGDEQRIDRIATQYNGLTYKHLLLPVWMLAYRYHDKPYRVVVNAATGEVNGERPYSIVKIALAVMSAASAAAGYAYLAGG